MEPIQFTYWLQGFCELTTEQPTPEQWQSIKEHLALVFKKETPPLKLDEMRCLENQFSNQNPYFGPPYIVGDSPLSKPELIC